MAFLAKESVTGGQLGSAIFGSIDIGSTIVSSINLAEDMNRGQTIAKRVVDYVTSTLPRLAKEAEDFAKLDPSALIKETLTYLPSYLQFITNNSMNASIQGAGGFKIAGAMLGLETKLYSSLNQVSLMTSILFDFPEKIASMKAARYWNKQLSPSVPNERDSYQLFVNGLLPVNRWLDRYLSEEGLSLQDSKNLSMIRRWQIGKPSLHDAYLMVRKGLKTEAFFYEIAQKGQGWERADAEALYEHYDYDFGVNEILRLADFVPLQNDWLEKKLTAQGLNTEDKALVKSALEKRVTRDEVQKMYALLLDNYAWGLLPQILFLANLAKWNFSAAEITIRLETAELLKDKLRLKLMRDAEIYLYRKGILDEDMLLSQLESLNIATDIANAIVRNEAAKKGIDWEIEE